MTNKHPKLRFKDEHATCSACGEKYSKDKEKVSTVKQNQLRIKS